MQSDVPYSHIRSQAQIDSLEVTVGELEAKILQLNSATDGLTMKFLELTELRHTLREVQVFFSEAGNRGNI